MTTIWGKKTIEVKFIFSSNINATYFKAVLTTSVNAYIPLLLIYTYEAKYIY